MPTALSVDLEEYFQVANFDGCIERSRWDALPSRVEAQTHRLLDLFNETGSRATFFVLDWVAERKPALIREVAARGHEIACHGHGHEIVYEIGRRALPRGSEARQGAIEAAAGTPVTGYRAPSFSITERSLSAEPRELHSGVQGPAVRRVSAALEAQSRGPTRATPGDWPPAQSTGKGGKRFHRKGEPT